MYNVSTQDQGIVTTNIALMFGSPLFVQIRLISWVHKGYKKIFCSYLIDILGDLFLAFDT